jgi:hypothetical protein
MRIAFSEDVLMDILMKRSPGYDASTKLLDAIVNGKAEGCAMLPTFININRMATEHTNAKEARDIVSEIAFILRVLPVPQNELFLSAFNSKMSFDDAMMSVSAEEGKADVIATNNVDDFKGSNVPAMRPKEIIAQLSKKMD